MTLVEWLESIQHKINNFESVNFATAFGRKIDMMITHIREKDARIAELEAATQWQPVADDEFLGSSIESKDDLLTMYGADGDSIFVYLPEDIRLCRKVQP